MPFYETVFVARPELSSKDVDAIQEIIEKEINNLKGSISRKEDWGLRQLSYMIKKCRRGQYRMLNYEVDSKAILEIDRKLRISEQVLRHLTVRTETLEKEPSLILQTGERDAALEAERLLEVEAEKAKAAEAEKAEKAEKAKAEKAEKAKPAEKAKTATAEKAKAEPKAKTESKEKAEIATAEKAEPAEKAKVATAEKAEKAEPKAKAEKAEKAKDAKEKGDKE